MKLTKLLVLGALCLFGTSAWAADLIERTAPEAPSPVIDADALAAIEKVAAEFEVGKYYVLYNPGAQQYFSQGNNWGTRASVSDLPILVRFTLPEGKTLEDNALFMNDYCIYSKAWKKVFFDSPTALFVDLNAQKNFYFQVIPSPAGNNLYRLQASEANPDYKPSLEEYAGFVGRDPAVEEDHTHNTETERNINLVNTYPLSPFMTEGWIEWEFYEVPSWNAYGLQKDAYDASVKLKAQIEKAEAAGVNTDAAITVYNNEGATAAELTEAIEALEAMLADNVATGTGQKPTDASMWIVNGTFDTIGDFTGWSTDNGKFGAGGEISTNAEVFGKNAFDINQDITVKYPGLYLFGVRGFYRAGGADDSFKRWTEGSDDARLAKFYVTVDGQTSEIDIDNIFEGAPTTMPAHGKAIESNGYYIPNLMTHANEFFHQDNLYGHLIPIEITGNDVSARIGVKKVATSYDAWSIFDDFTLTFCGAGEDRYIGYAKALASYLPKYETEFVSHSYIDPYQTLLSTPNATDKASAEAYVAELKAMLPALKENIALWKEWEVEANIAVDAMEKYMDFEDASVDALIDYADGQVPTIRENRSLTNEELEAEIAKAKEVVAAVIEAAKKQVKDGDDMTTFLTNPDFSEGQKGWTGWKTVASQKWNDNQTKNMPTVNESCAEAFSAPNFDLYQEVEGLPLGIYEVNVQGFFRFGRGDDAWNEWNKTGEDRADYVKTDDPALGSPVFFYVNEKETPFINVYQEVEGKMFGRTGDDPLFDDLNTPENEGRTPLTKTITDEVVTGVENCQRVTDNEGNYLFFPDGMKSAHNYFNAGDYMQTTFSAVAHQGDKLRIGVKGHSNVGVSATNLDSWAIFDNFKLTYRGKDKAVVKPVLEDAIVVAKAKQNLAIAKDVKEELAAAIVAAETAVANDVDDMFSVLANLWGVDVNGSLQKIQGLKDALTPFENAINSADEADEDLRPRQSVIEEATVVRNKAQKYVGGEEEFTNADIDAILKQMEELTDALKVPEKMETASDDNEVNATYLITNPTYDVNSEKDRTLPNGWKQEGTDAGNYRANSGVYEVWNAHVDVLAYQDLEKMPAGTYKLSVQGIYRYGWADNEYKAYTEDATVNNNGVLYVKVGENDAVTRPLPRLATLAAPYEAEVKTNDDGEPALNDKGEKQYEPTLDWVWAQKTVSEDESMASGYITPDMLSTLTPFFDDETVQPTSIIFQVGEEGKARIGINIKHVVDGDWVVWDNWTLTYYGPNSTKDPDVVDGIKDASTIGDVVKTEVYNLSGAQVKNGKGIAIVRQTLSNGTVRVKKVMVK